MKNTKSITIATLLLTTALTANAGFFGNDNDGSTNWGPFDSGSNLGPFNGMSNWMNDTDFGFNFNTKNKVDNKVSGQAEGYAKGYADAQNNANKSFFVSEQQHMLAEQAIN
jgi:hypothetical protein